MVYRLGLLLCLLLTACSAPRQTTGQANVFELAGVLAGETVLHDIVHLVADVRVPVGARLVIEPGSTILVHSTDSTKIDPEFLSSKVELLVEGELVVGAAGAEPVHVLPYVTVGSEDAGEPGWAGIELIAGGVGRFNNVRLSGAETALLVSGASAVLDQVVVTDNRYGVILQNGGRFSGTDVLIDRGETGILCWGEGSLDIRRGNIVGHDEEGVVLGPGCQTVLQEVEIRGNDLGLVGSAMETGGIRFVDNRVDHLQRVEVGP